VFRQALDRACGKYQKGSFAPDERATSFWRQYRTFCISEYADLGLTGLEGLQSKNDPWPRFAAVRLPTDVRLEHKPWKGHVDLTFNGRTMAELYAIFSSGIPSGLSIVRVGGSAALRSSIPPIHHLDPFPPQVAAVRAALDSARALLGHWQSLRTASLEAT